MGKARSQIKRTEPCRQRLDPVGVLTERLLCATMASAHPFSIIGMNEIEPGLRPCIEAFTRTTPYFLVAWTDVSHGVFFEARHPKYVRRCFSDLTKRLRLSRKASSILLRSAIFLKMTDHSYHLAIFDNGRAAIVDRKTTPISSPERFVIDCIRIAFLERGMNGTFFGGIRRAVGFGVMYRLVHRTSDQFFRTPA